MESPLEESIRSTGLQEEGDNDKGDHEESERIGLTSRSTDQFGNDHSDDVGGSVHENTLKSYLHQWQIYFADHENGEELLNKLKARAFEESLRSCHFRSICWRLFLGCLPSEIDKWVETIRKQREHYRQIQMKHLAGPQDASLNEDLQMENPLSQNDSSSWSRYFKKNELKNLIMRDVRRTCPEMTFFHNEVIRDTMSNVLLCYALEHENISYRQGMHELLAPLVFVLHCDVQGAAHAREIGALPDIINDIFKEDFLEHDAYALFCNVMDATNSWYSVTQQHNDAPVDEKDEDADDNDKQSPIPTVPFQNPSITNPSNKPPLAITNKLNHIHGKLLALHDMELYHHLNRLEIIPQVYGLRWVRLLFGREFDLQDLLVLWDALFADSHTLDLVDYIFVAMMCNISHELFSGDYCECMQLLMKYPPIEDIYDLVRLAMHFRDPEKYGKPPGVKWNPKKPSLMMQQPASQNVPRKIIPNFNNPFSNLSKNLKKGFLSSPGKKKDDDALRSGNTSIQQGLLKRAQSDRSTSSAFERIRSLSGRDSAKKKDEEEIASLKQQLKETQEKCYFCADKIEASIRLLQPYLVKKFSQESMNKSDPSNANQPSEEHSNISDAKVSEPLVVIANLKQVRDMLRGSLSITERRHTPSESESLVRALDGLPDPPEDFPQDNEA